MTSLFPAFYNVGFAANTSRKMASDRFVKFTEVDLNRSVMLARRRKLHLTKIYKEFLAREDEKRELKQIPAAKLQQFAIKFVLTLKI